MDKKLEDLAVEIVELQEKLEELKKKIKAKHLIFETYPYNIKDDDIQ